jgi:hypothetical protein
VSYAGGYDVAFSSFAGVALLGIAVGAPAARRSIGAGAGAGPAVTREPTRVP